MYVYIQSESRLFTVGFYKPDGTWEPESDHTNDTEASARVGYLNGGHDSFMAERVATLEVQVSELRNRAGVAEVDEVHERAMADRC